MTRCYFHPKLAASHRCKGCQLPICPHCMDGLHCPDCTKRIRYAQGRPTAPAPRLVPPSRLRSLTRDLILDRLHGQAGVRRPIRREPPPRRTRKGLGGAASLAGLTLAALVVGHTYLGLAHPAHAAAPAHIAEALPLARPIVPRPVMRTDYVYVPPPPVRIAFHPPPAPQPIAYPIAHPIEAVMSPTVAATPTPPPPIRPAAAMAWPMAGSVLKAAPVLQVAIAHPEAVSQLHLLVDGEPVATPIAARGNTSIAWDTRHLSDGDHMLQVVGTSRNGQPFATAQVPVSVQN